MLPDQDEDVGMKVIRLERKTNDLEKLVNEISKQTHSVLFDVRNVLTELDNPMNYLKGLGIDEVMISMAENITEKKLTEFMERKLDDYTKSVVESKLKESTDQLVKKFIDEQVGGIIEGKIKEMKDKGILKVPINPDELKEAMEDKMAEIINSEEMQEKMKEDLIPILEGKLKKALIRDLKEPRLEPQEAPPRGENLPAVITQEAQSVKPKEQEAVMPSKIGSVGLTACAGSLMQMFGRKGAESIVDDYYKRGWIDYELRQSLLELMSTIQTRDIPDEKDIGVNEHAIAAYLFDKLTKNGSDLDFVVIMVSLTSTEKVFITK